jgi:hypothetical protein
MIEIKTRFPELARRTLERIYLDLGLLGSLGLNYELLQSDKTAQSQNTIEGNEVQGQLLGAHDAELYSESGEGE